MEDNEQPPAPIREASAPEVVERPLWVLSRDEQRVLIITFVGGLASVVAGVCVIGGALALVRGLRAIHLSLGLLAYSTAVYIFAVVLGFYTRRRGPESSLRGIDRVAVFVCWALCIAAGLGRFGCGHPLMRCPPGAQ